MAPLKNHREKPRVEVKLQSFMADINRIKNRVISEGRNPTDTETAEIEELRGYIKNLEKIKRIELNAKKDNR